MYKSSRVIIPVIILLLLCILPFKAADTFADDSITVTDTSTFISYPDSLVFKISAQSDTEITRIRLNYVVDKLNYASIVSEAWPVLVPSTEIETLWEWDMRQISLPPEVTIEYWWTVENLNNRIVTDKYSVVFSDTNHTWKKTSSGMLNIYWYEGDDEFVDVLMQSAIDASGRLTTDAGIDLEKPVNIYVYNGPDDFQQSLVNIREWTGGVAMTDYNAISIGIAPDETDWGIKALAHELGHLVVHQITYSPYSVHLPTWLDEGLAMHAEGSSDELLQTILKKALEEDKLISLQSLSSPFSAVPYKAYLSYAQSESIVKYLMNEYGKTRLMELLKIFKSGSTTDDALYRIYGLNQLSLESYWVTSMKAQSINEPSSIKELTGASETK